MKIQFLVINISVIFKMVRMREIAMAIVDKFEFCYTKLNLENLF